MKLFYRVRFGKLREENRVIEKAASLSSSRGKNASSRGIRKKKEDNYRQNHKLKRLNDFFISELIFVHLFSLILKLKMNREWHGNKEFEIASFFS